MSDASAIRVAAATWLAGVGAPILRSGRRHDELVAHQPEQTHETVTALANIGDCVAQTGHADGILAVEINGPEETINRIAVGHGVAEPATPTLEALGKVLLLYKMPPGQRVPTQQLTQDVRVHGEGSVIPVANGEGVNWVEGRSPADIPQPLQAPATFLAGLTVIPREEAGLPEIDLKLLPAPMGNYVESVARSIDAPIDAAALVAIGVIAACLSRRAVLCIGHRDHREVSALWFAVAMASGERKSAVHREVHAPLFEREFELLKSYRLELALWETREAIRDTKKKRLTAACGQKENKTRAADEEELRNVEIDRRNDPRPASPALTVANVTPEALLKIMAEQDGCADLNTDEGGIFAQLADNSSRVQNIDPFLHGYSGSAIDEARIGRGRTAIPRAVLNLRVMLQPPVLEQMWHNRHFRGKGFQARFLPAFPKSRVGTRRYRNQQIDPAAKAEWTAVVRTLYDVAKGEIVYTIEGEALTVWTAFHDRIEGLMAAGGPLAHMTDWASKLAGNVARIALVFHAIEARKSNSRQVTPDAVRRAIELADTYLVPHALHAFRNADKPQPKEPPEGDKVMEEFVNEHLVVDERAESLFADIYHAYGELCGRHNAPVRSTKIIAKRLRQIRDVVPCKNSASACVYRGLRLKV